MKMLGTSAGCDLSDQKKPTFEMEHRGIGPIIPAGKKRIFIKLSILFGSGTLSVTVGLSGVGPPPTLRIIQIFAS